MYINHTKIMVQSKQQACILIKTVHLDPGYVCFLIMLMNIEFPSFPETKTRCSVSWSKENRGKRHSIYMLDYKSLILVVDLTTGNILRTLANILEKFFQ